MAGGLGFPRRPINTGHFRYECKHGIVVSQCRCPGGRVTIVACPDRCPDADQNDE